MGSRASEADAKHTVAASGLVGLLSYAAARGVDRGEVLAAIGVADAELAGPEARVSQGAYNAAWAYVARASADPDLGLHFAERLVAPAASSAPRSLEAFDVVGHLVARSETLGEGLARVVAYSRILHDAGRIEVEPAGEEVTVFPGCRGLPFEAPRHVAEFAAASVLVLARAVTGVAITPRAARFRHVRPPRTAEHRRILGVAPEFGAQETAVVLARDALALPIRGSDPGVVTYLDAYARDVLARLPAAEGLASQVERVVAARLTGGVPGTRQVARHLGLSERTLQRRLEAEGRSFHEIVEGVRRAYAERYLRDERLPLREIGFLVGFGDPSNFHRAFRRWTAQTPAAYRAAHAAAPKPR